MLCPLLPVYTKETINALEKEQSDSMETQEVSINESSIMKNISLSSSGSLTLDSAYVNDDTHVEGGQIKK